MDDIAAFTSGSNEELVESAEKVLKKSKKEVEEGLKLSITEGGKEGKSKVTTSSRSFRNAAEPSSWERKRRREGKSLR